MRKIYQTPIWLVLFCFLAAPFQSCVDTDDFDLDKISKKIEWQPNFVGPIGYGEMSLWTILNQHKPEKDQTIVLGTDGLIHIKYTKEDIFEYEVDEILNFPSQAESVININLPIPAVGLPITAAMVLPEVAESYNISTDNAAIILKEVNLNSIMKFTMTNPLNTTVKLDVQILSGKINDAPVSETYTVRAGVINQKEKLDLTNLILKFKEPLSINNTIDLKFVVTVNPNGSNVLGTGNPLSIKYQVGDIKMLMAKGDFGQKTIDIGSGDIDMDIDFWDDVDGKFTFSDPRINIKFNNKVGVPFKILANMTASNSDGETLNLDPDPLLPSYPTSEAEVIAGIDASILYDKTNSQIVPFMALPPSGEITYSGSIEINKNLDGSIYNPLTDGNNINIITEASSITADLEMDIPMDFKANNLSISDTTDVDIDDAEKMVKAAIMITSENGLPLDVTIKNIFFTDAAYKIITSISDQNVIKAAGITATGEVDPTTINKVVNTIELTESEIQSLNETKYIIFKAGVSTYDEGKVAVKLKGTDKLKFAISINAQLDLSK